MKRILLNIGLLMILNTTSYCQDDYFEYNNPSAIEITDVEIDLLTSKTWYSNDLIDYLREDTINTSFTLI